MLNCAALNILWYLAGGHFHIGRLLSTATSSSPLLAFYRKDTVQIIWHLAVLIRKCNGLLLGAMTLILNLLPVLFFPNFFSAPTSLTKVQKLPGITVL